MCNAWLIHRYRQHISMDVMEAQAASVYLKRKLQHPIYEQTFLTTLEEAKETVRRVQKSLVGKVMSSSRAVERTCSILSE